MPSDRLTRRKTYWEHKHSNPEWADEMHLPFFRVGQIGVEAFEQGLRANTEGVLRELNEYASLFHLGSGLKVLDFGCGAGDLLIQLARSIPDARGIGIDIASSAIEKAKRSASDANVSPRLEWFDKGVGSLSSLVQSHAGGIHVILCREVFYLLDLEEQTSVLTSFKSLLAPAGVLYLADLVVAEPTLPLLDTILIERQSAGAPITWKEDGHGGRSYSLLRQTQDAGFAPLRPASVDETAVADSYRVAAVLNSGPTADKYAALSDLAAIKSSGLSAIPYVKWWFRHAEECHPPDHQNLIHIRCDKRLMLGGRLLLEQGVYEIPANRWTLILGRSGAGKTTLLRLLSGMLKLPNVVVEFPKGLRPKAYYLTQKPPLVEEMTILENLKLFAADTTTLNNVMTTLGFGAEMSSRIVNSKLSGGEWQRVALGQAMVANPDLLLLDEPGSGIDRVRRYQLFWTLRETLGPGSVPAKTVICVDHEFTLIESFFDIVIEMVSGRLVWVNSRPRSVN
jgi:ABC-type nitrate/sulfonate/bicarbonate transport system ATPase subunit